MGAALLALHRQMVAGSPIGIFDLKQSLKPTGILLYFCAIRTGHDTYRAKHFAILLLFWEKVIL